MVKVKPKNAKYYHESDNISIVRCAVWNKNFGFCTRELQHRGEHEAIAVGSEAQIKILKSLLRSE